MPLDPDVKAFLDQIAAAKAPSLPEMPIAEGRAAYEAMAQLSAAQSVPIGRIDALEAEGPAGPIRLRVYRPVGGARTLPAVLFYHGGGFTIGSLDTHDELCRRLANESGAAVVAVDYRLAPEHPFPAAVEDAFAALRFVEAHAALMDVDANALAVAGDSAGGNLAAVAAILARDAGGPRIVHQGLIYPTVLAGADTPSMHAFGEGHLLERATMEWFTANYLPDPHAAADPRASPLLAERLEGVAPATIITAECDPLRDEGKAYADRLAAAGVDVHYVCYEGQIHGFMQLAGLFPKGQAAIAELGRRLAASL